MNKRRVRAALPWLALASAALLLLAIAYLAVLGSVGGLQFVIDTSQPPDWAARALTIWTLIVGAWALSVVLLTLGLSVVQLDLGPRPVVIGGLVAFVVAMAAVYPALQTSDLAQDLLGRLIVFAFATYLAAVNAVGLHGRLFGRGRAILGFVLAGLLAVVGFGGQDAWALVLPALGGYGLWAAWLGFGWLLSDRRGVPPEAPARS